MNKSKKVALIICSLIFLIYMIGIIIYGIKITLFNILPLIIEIKGLTIGITVFILILVISIYLTYIFYRSIREWIGREDEDV